MDLAAFIFLALTFGIGIGAGYFLRILVALGTDGSLEQKLREKQQTASAKMNDLIDEAKTKARHILQEAETLAAKREDSLLRRTELLASREKIAEEQLTEANRTKKEIENERLSLQDMKVSYETALEQLSGLSSEEAKDLLLDEIEETYSEDLLVRMRKMDLLLQKQLEERGRNVIINSLERLTQSVVADHTVTIVTIDDPDLKGRIIGKDGRNIKAFERESGVELLIDENEDSITISSFDPLRREIARRALEALLEDGRIQPARIESALQTAKTEVDQLIKRKGEEAALQTDIIDLPDPLIYLLGRMHFRTSYGQNVLQHSLQVATLSALLAEELGLDVKVAKTAGLLHDIGKVASHELPGSHVTIGERILEKYKVPTAVITAMRSHHNDYPHGNPEAAVVQAADIISASRPGARRDSVEAYLRRLGELEDIASSFSGVDRAYAIEAGREVRVFVRSDDLTELEAKHIARQIALRISAESRVPGEIKINVIRETRVIEYAR